MIKLFVTIVWYFMALVLSFIMFPIVLVVWMFVVLFDKNLKTIHILSCFWASLFLWINPFWKIEIIDRKKIDPKKAYVMISNHQSMTDILIIYRLFAFFKWVSKIENFKVPIIGWNMRLNRYIEIVRGDSKSSGEMINTCVKTLKRNVSIMIFPEGTRSVNGDLRRFKDGAFVISKNAEVGILPIVLDGTGKAIPKKSWVLGGNQVIKIKVLDPISAEEVNETGLNDLKNKSQSIIQEELDKLRAV